MRIATVAIDLAKTVFELAAADERGRVVERRRLSRAQLVRWFDNRDVEHVVMEACATGHYWGRWCQGRGMRVSLIPPLYVRAYVRRNKTDQADATALLEASRASDIIPVRVKSIEQQALQGLHRVRAAWRRSCTARINTLRGLCQEFGIVAPVGSRRGLAELARQVADESSAVPALLRPTLRVMLEEIRALQERMRGVEAELATLARQSEECTRLQSIPGVGLIGATALAGTVGDISGFRSGRQFASWLGLTPREHSSGQTRRLGAISKRGDAYLRTLLVHGGRAVLTSADCAQRAGRPLDALRAWALRVRARTSHNKAAVAVANKIARIIWATWRAAKQYEPREPVPIAA